jgi:hypothetical protein
VTHLCSLVKLDALHEELTLVFEVLGSKVLPNCFFHLSVLLLRDVGLLGENVSNQRSEERQILGYELGQVHVTKSSCHNHFLVSTWWLGSL